MTVLFQKMIHREDLRSNPRVLYLFGDNAVRRGMGGQAAAMRGEQNAVGVRTKLLPHNNPDAFLRDADIATYEAWWREDLDRPITANAAGMIVVLPLDGLGTGRARLFEIAPRSSALLARLMLPLMAGMVAEA